MGLGDYFLSFVAVILVWTTIELDESHNSWIPGVIASLPVALIAGVQGTIEEGYGLGLVYASGFGFVIFAIVVVVRYTQREAMKKTLRNIVVVVLFAAAFFVAKYAIQQFRMSATAKEVAAIAEKGLKKLRQKAIAENPGLPESVALLKEAQRHMAQSLKNAESQLEKVTIAADAFFTIYFMNTRSRLKFCLEQGIDLRPFVSTYSKLHLAEYDKAKAIYKRAGEDEENLWKLIQQFTEDVVKRDMLDMSARQQLSVRQVCEFLAVNAETVVPYLHFSKRAPAVYEVLSQAK